jgi:hypothetical protein
MSKTDLSRKLRWLVALLGLAVIIQAGFFIYALLAHKLPPVWPMLAGDLVFSALVLFVLWRTLGRRSKG